MPLEVTENFIRERKLEPNNFDKRSFRAQFLKNSTTHKGIFACPTRLWSPEANRCKISPKLQSILHPKKEFKEKCKHGRCKIKDSRFSY
ncbi:MAG: hypothetical protein AABY22_31955 [Nanoarchaeota archaeon]